MEAAVIGGLAGVVGLLIGRLWDAQSESRKWRRDQRISTYERLVGSYYLVREAMRTLALLPVTAEDADCALARVLDLGAEWNRDVVAVWLHGSGPVAAAVENLDRRLNELLDVARAEQLTFDEWRQSRQDVQECLATFIAAVRLELSLPNLEVRGVQVA